METATINAKTVERLKASKKEFEDATPAKATQPAGSGPCSTPTTAS